jgi:hypothetical protein
MKTLFLVIILTSLSLPQNSPDSVLNYYPLREGIKWVYNLDYYSRFNQYNYDFTCEVIGDTVMQDNKKYYIVETHELSEIKRDYERIDSVNAYVIRYNFGLLYKLNLAPGDTFSSGGIKWYLIGIYSKNILGVQRQDQLFDNQNPYGYSRYELANGLGLYHNYSSLGYGWARQSIVLKGIIIDGQVYGDTTVLSSFEQEIIPENISLFQNYPNPFNPVTDIDFNLSQQSFVLLKVYDPLGRELFVLLNEEKGAGLHKVKFNGSGLPSGIYYYSLTSKGSTITKKMILLK